MHFLNFGPLQKHQTIYIYKYSHHSHLYIHLKNIYSTRNPIQLVGFHTVLFWATGGFSERFSGAGKSTLVQAFLSEAAGPLAGPPEAEGPGPTVGADFKVRTLKHAGKDWPAMP